MARRFVEASSFVTEADYNYARWNTHAKDDETMRDQLMSPLNQALSTQLEGLEH